MIDLERMKWSKADVKKWWEQEETKRVRSAENVTPIPRPQHGEKFIRGPIPLDWAEAAIAAGDHPKSGKRGTRDLVRGRVPAKQSNQTNTGHVAHVWRLAKNLASNPKELRVSRIDWVGLQTRRSPIVTIKAVVQDAQARHVTAQNNMSAQFTTKTRGCVRTSHRTRPPAQQVLCLVCQTTNVRRR